MNTPNAHWDDPEDREPPRAPPSAEIGATSPNYSLRTPHVIPYLFPIEDQTLISYDSSLNAETLAMVLSATISTGGILPLFGQATPLPVVLCHQVAKGDAQADIQALWDALADQEGRTAGFENIEIWDFDRINDSGNGGTPQLFNSPEVRQKFREQVSSRAVIVIYDLKIWIGEEPKEETYREILDWFDELSTQGNTVIIFEANTALGAPSLKGLFSSDKDTITALPDPGAPHQLGGGFTLHRHRKGYFDNGPAIFQYWYKVVEQTFEWGLESRVTADVLSAKANEILQRQIKVAYWLKNNASQKEIAVRLHCNAATVSRDAATLRRQNGYEP